MPVPEHIKIVFRGVFDGTPEIWSFGTKWSSKNAGDPDAHADNVGEAGIITALNGLLNNSNFQASAICDGFRAYDIGTDGNMVGNPKIVEWVGAARIKGTAAAHKFPPQIALCVTTEAEDRGPGRLGRFFLPGPAISLDTDGRLSTGGVATYSGLITQFLKDVSDSIDAPFTLVGSSMLNVSAVGAGTSQVVKRIRLGRVYDTLRTRRSAMDEAYVPGGDIDW